jgi:hypothetical protein
MLAFEVIQAYNRSLLRPRHTDSNTMVHSHLRTRPWLFSTRLRCYRCFLCAQPRHKPQVTSHSIPRESPLAAEHASQHPRQRPPQVVPDPSKNGSKAKPMASAGLASVGVMQQPEPPIPAGKKRRRIVTKSTPVQKPEPQAPLGRPPHLSPSVRLSPVAQWQISKQHSQCSKHTIHCPTMP